MSGRRVLAHLDRLNLTASCRWSKVWPRACQQGSGEEGGMRFFI